MYIKKINRVQAGGEDAEELVRKIHESIIAVETEVERYDFLQPRNMRNAFPDSDREFLDDMRHAREIIRAKLLDALKMKDLNAVQQQLKQMRQVSMRFMELASRRYHEFLVEELKE
jgi:hypothetical protein